MTWIDVDRQPEALALDDTLVMALGNFVRWVVGENLPIVRGWTNAVSRPPKSYVLITPMSATWQSTTYRMYTPPEDIAQKGQLRVWRSMRRRVQVDLYGPQAEVHARACATLFQDLTGCSFLKQYDLTPLTVTDPQQLTLAVGNEQAQPRWMFECDIQAGERFSTVQLHLDFFDAVNFQQYDCLQLMQE